METALSKVLHNLIQDLRTLTADELSTIHYEPWLSDLEACEEAFLAAVKGRTEEQAARTTGAAKAARTQMDAAYRNLVERVNALAVVNGDADYATFIDHVNVLIDRQRTVLRARATGNTKKKSAEA